MLFACYMGMCQASVIGAKLGEGWRLPTKDELEWDKVLRKYAKIIDELQNRL